MKQQCIKLHNVANGLALRDLFQYFLSTPIAKNEVL